MSEILNTLFEAESDLTDAASLLSYFTDEAGVLFEKDAPSDLVQHVIASNRVQTGALLRQSLNALLAAKKSLTTAKEMLGEKVAC